MSRVTTIEPIRTQLDRREARATELILKELVDDPRLTRGNKVTVTAYLHEASVKSKDEVSDILVSVSNGNNVGFYRVAVDSTGEHAMIKNSGYPNDDLRITRDGNRNYLTETLELEVPVHEEGNDDANDA